MTKFDGGRLLRAAFELEKCKTHLETVGVHSYAGTLSHFENACRDLPFSDDFIASVRRLLDRAARGTDSPEVIRALAEEMDRRFFAEYNAFGFYAIPARRMEPYSEPERWFGHKIFAKFPKTRRDAIDGCRCYALGQWTASVFHSMRVLEHGLQALATHVGVTLAFSLSLADWQVLLDGIDAKIRAARGTAKSQARADELEALSRCGSELTYCKHAFRDYVSHAREGGEPYNEEDARDILAHVKNIMSDLTERIA